MSWRASLVHCHRFSPLGLLLLWACGGEAASTREEGRDASLAVDAATDDSSAFDASRRDGGAANEQADAATASDASVALRSITLRFVAKMGERAFGCGEQYQNVGSTGSTVEPLDFKLYVQDVRLIDDSGASVPLRLEVREPWQSDDVSLLDFANDMGGCAAEGTVHRNEVIIGSVPQGRYRGLAFVVGVPEELNHQDPTTLPSPLQNGGMQWSWLLGYRFLKLEVQQVVTPPAIAGIGMAHTGSTACGGTPASGFECRRPNRIPVRFDAFDPDQDRVVVDAAAVFATTDLSGEAQCHGTGEACPAVYEQLGIDYESGEPLGEQQVFLVE